MFLFFFRTKLEDIPSNDLASFLNAFVVSCIDPRKFYGMDIVQELRNRVDKQNYTNPYVLLSLCNAGERITESDKEKLIETFWNKRRTFWTGKVFWFILICSLSYRKLILPNFFSTSLFKRFPITLICTLTISLVN